MRFNKKLKSTRTTGNEASALSTLFDDNMSYINLHTGSPYKVPPQMSKGYIEKYVNRRVRQKSGKPDKRLRHNFTKVKSKRPSTMFMFDDQQKEQVRDFSGWHRSHLSVLYNLRIIV